MSFREHIQQHIDDKVIMVEMCHINSITFDDICILIHLITTQEIKVKLSPEVKTHLDYDMFTNHSSAMLMPDVSNGEELIVLLYLPQPKFQYLPTFNVEIMYYSYSEQCYNYMGNPKYNMSDRFFLAAKKYGIIGYPITIRIIANYNIPVEYSTDEAGKSLREYMNIQKSARYPE